MAGVALVAVAVPVGRRVLDDEPPSTRQAAAAPRRVVDDRAATAHVDHDLDHDHDLVPQEDRPPRPRTKTTTTTAPRTTTTTAPTTTTARTTTTATPGPPGIRIQLVPPVSEVTLEVGGALATTDASGVVAVAAARGRVPVRFVGYETVPALEQVRFRQWSDGSREPRRPVDADGRGNLSIAVDLSYRITVARPGRPAPVEATTSLGRRRIRTGTASWLLAARGVVHGGRVRTVALRYRFDSLPGRPVLVPTPEALWTLPR